MPYTKSKKFRINGDTIEVFPVSYLANALGRTSQTVRKWEISGVIPRCFVDPTSKVRFYSQEQIDTIVSLAEKCRITQGKSISQSTFTAQVTKALNSLNAKYRTNNNNNKEEKNHAN